jgi:tRNA(Ile)-lysidine synthase
VQVLALHVHHGLSRAADAWEFHAHAQCNALVAAGCPVRFESRRVRVSAGGGQSVEDAARRARYAALREMATAHGATLVLLAHHRRDQAETFFLQALRGAGVAGLAGMPRIARREGIDWARPWLAMPRAAIESYIAAHGLAFVEDDSNLDTRFARNRLRQRVWPALEEAFPQAETALASAATWAQQADAALADLAEMDLRGCSDALGLDVAAWASLPMHRRSNALREWLRRASGARPAAALLLRLLHEVPERRGPAHWEAIGGELRRYRGRLKWAPAQAAAAHSREPLEASLHVQRAGRVPLAGWGGVLRIARVAEGGIPIALLRDATLAARQGAERFQAGPRQPARALKKQYQAAGVPEWMRGGPLVFSAGVLLFVPGLGLDARACAVPGEPRVDLSWEPERT